MIRSASSCSSWQRKSCARSPLSFSVQSGFLLASLVVGDQLRGDAQDRFAGAIVLLEPDHFGVGIVLFKVEDVLDVRAPPGVDGLVRIADDADVPVPQGHRVGEHILGVVGVLVFVDEQVVESLLNFLEHVRKIAKRLGGAQEQIVEIQRVVLRQQLLVLCINPRDRSLVKIGAPCRRTPPATASWFLALLIVPWTCPAENSWRRCPAT